MDVKNDKYSFERLDSTKYSDLVSISKSAFGIDPGVEYYSKKNATQKFGIPDLGFIAYARDGTPAAFYGIYSQPLIFNDTFIHAGQSGDTMTHKDHMGQGLFVILANKTYDLAIEFGLEFVFGFPNEKSFPGFQKKLNWEFKEKVKEYRIKVFTFPLAKIASKVSVLAKLYTWYSGIVLKYLTQSGHSFKCSCLENDIGSVNRTSDYYEYKFKNKNFIININGVNVWIKIDAFLFIGDIERSDNIDYKLLIKQIKRVSFFLGIDCILFQTSPDTFLDKKIGKILESKDAFYVGFRNLNSVVDPKKFKFVFGDADTF